MKKEYTADQLLKMAVKKAAVDPNADLNGDFAVNASDARLADRGEEKPADSAYEYREDASLAGMRAELLAEIAAGRTDDFSVNADRLYEQYRRRYEQNARAAAENAYGLAAAGTGGYGNSWASAAANAAYNGMMEGLTDRALEIDSLKEKQQQTAYENALRALSAVNDAEETSYDRYRDRLDLAFAAAKQGDYSLMEELDIDTSALRRKDVTALAELAAKYGDDSYLAALGVDTSQLRYNDLLGTALKLSQAGDYSALEALGVDVETLRQRDLLERAEALAKYGDYSLLGTFSENLSGLKQKVSVTVQKGAEAAYAYGGYASLVKYLNKQVGYGQLNEAGKRQILTLLTGGGYGA